jgi:hypothetical protein
MPIDRVRRSALDGMPALTLDPKTMVVYGPMGQPVVNLNRNAQKPWAEAFVRWLNREAEAVREEIKAESIAASARHAGA